MQENEMNDSFDIMSASSEERKFTVSKPIAKSPSDGLGNVVKAIAFIVGFVMIAVTFVGAFFLYSKAPLFMAIALAVIIAGTLSAAMVTVLIYAIGHLIVQNNKIITKLNEIDRF